MIGGTRFIYNEKSENGISFLVRNTDETPFLIQTKVLPYETGGNIKQGAPNNPSKTDFVATPPLLPLRKNRKIMFGSFAPAVDYLQTVKAYFS